MLGAAARTGRLAVERLCVNCRPCVGILWYLCVMHAQTSTTSPIEYCCGATPTAMMPTPVSRLVLLVIAVSAFAFASAAPAAAAETFVRARVMRVTGEEQVNIGENVHPLQHLHVRLMTGDRRGEEIDVDDAIATEHQRARAGDTLVLVQETGDDGDQFFVHEFYRLPRLLAAIAAFAFAAILFARRKGFFSLIGLSISILVLTLFIVPHVARGQNPLVISFIGALLIAVVSLYLAHGVNRRTTIALASTLTALILSLAMASLAVVSARLFGLGSEEAFYAQFGPLGSINMRGLLLGAMMIGTLGVLDDITTSQAAAVEEIHHANPALSSQDLFRRGLSVGREHIASLVNTLVLAYAGVSLPLLLLFTTSSRPLWVTLNSEAVAEEMIRSIVGAITLMCAVPLTTFLASRFLRKEPDPQREQRAS
jgi:uncharacterized membrane protein